MAGLRGFTLIELLVVLAVVASLTALVAPRYMAHVERSKEVVLRHNLQAMRDSIDRFHADRARYPSGLDELVRERYLKSIPVDPVTDRADTWVVAPPARDPMLVGDVRSGAVGTASDGSAYATW